MTLNLMLTSRSAVFLSGDFRITYRYPDGRVRWVDDVHTQKVIPVFKFGWSALVAFTGVAATPQVGDIGDWISHQLQEIRLDAGFEELPSKLLAAESWLSKISDDRRIAFSVVGFVQRRPYAMVISNFLDLDGHFFNPPLPQLQRFETRPKRPEVWVAGDGDAVQRRERETIKDLLSDGRKPREIQSEIARINATAAERSRLISPECVTGHLLPSGAAAVTPHGISDRVEYMPGFVRRDLAANGIVAFKCKVDEHGRALPPSWKGMTAKVQGKGHGNQVVGVIHAFGNVEEPVAAGTASNTRAFWKIVGENEPEHYTFQLTDQEEI